MTSFEDIRNTGKCSDITRPIFCLRNHTHTVHMNGWWSNSGPNVFCSKTETTDGLG